jgi:hypothetical protein|uniref:Uncharacterized protein n=1 Tax=viral metagenome TaxID=1070528 RepID=A0A6C0CTR9_9ZZZZ
MPTLMNVLISLIVSLVITMVYIGCSEKNDTDRRTKLFAIAITSFVLSFIAQALLFGAETYSFEGGADRELGTMLQNIDVDNEVPF